jgi:hypothetical protein
MEISKQAYLTSGESEVGPYNRFMNRRNRANRYDLDDDSTRHNNVCAISAVKFRTFIGHSNGLLSLESHASGSKLAAETFFVNGFQQSRTGFSVDGDGCSVDFVRELYIGHKRAKRRGSEDREKNIGIRKMANISSPCYSGKLGRRA